MNNNTCIYISGYVDEIMRRSLELGEKPNNRPLPRHQPPTLSSGAQRVNKARAIREHVNRFQH